MLTGTPMKALTLYPTWAVLIMLEKKRLETRGWQTAHRGPIAIATSQRLAHDDRLCLPRPEYQKALAPAGFRAIHDLPLGVIVCTALLTDIYPVEDVRDTISAEERAFGNYEDGRFAWRLEGIEIMRPPLPCRGRQMLWDADLAALRAAARSRSEMELPLVHGNQNP